MTTEPVARIARAAAQRLTSARHPMLVTDVEAALHKHAAGHGAFESHNVAARPEQYLDPVALGGLIVATANLVWVVYNDLRKRATAPRPEVVTRHVRIRLDELESPLPALTPAERERIIAVIVEETLAVPPEPESGD
ncbi:hypothetical protein ACWGE1_36350 [Streptomyces sp. NPDC054932]